MPKAPPTHSLRAARSRRDPPRGKTAERGYGWRWQVAARRYLEHNPYCRECMRQARPTRATCVDHVIPHRGDMTLFWDEENWQPLCDRCHSRKTAQGQ